MGDTNTTKKSGDVREENSSRMIEINWNDGVYKIRLIDNVDINFLARRQMKLVKKRVSTNSVVK